MTFSKIGLAASLAVLLLTPSAGWALTCNSGYTCPGFECDTGVCRTCQPTSGNDTTGIGSAAGLTFSSHVTFSPVGNCGTGRVIAVVTPQSSTITGARLELWNGAVPLIYNLFKNCNGGCSFDTQVEGALQPGEPKLARVTVDN